MAVKLALAFISVVVVIVLVTISQLSTLTTHTLQGDIITIGTEDSVNLMVGMDGVSEDYTIQSARYISGDDVSSNIVTYIGIIIIVIVAAIIGYILLGGVAWQ